MAQVGYGYGSEWHLLSWLGWQRAAFTTAVSAATGVAAIDWLDRHLAPGDPSPRELRGLEFLASSDPVRQEWEQLWPQTGNVHNWDAVGRGGDDHRPTWLLVEAKANLTELVSKCSATDPQSLTLINEALTQAQTALGAQPGGPWTERIYQLANRVTMLHHLVSHGVEAHLVLVCFVGDRTDVGGQQRSCPADAGGWAGALAEQDRLLGLPPGSPWQQRIHHLFLPAYRVGVNRKILKPQYGGT